MTNIYRITHIDNLESILENEGQYSRTLMTEGNISYRNISYESIQGRRANFDVPLPPHGDLHDYVPFYFTNRSPMLYACHTNSVDNYDEGQEPIIYLVTTVQNIQNSGRTYSFTDGHACMAGTSFYNNLNDLNRIDWDVINSWSWRNRDNDLSRKQRKQAEFLVHEFVPLQAFDSIAVLNREMRQEVESILTEFGSDIPVQIQERWYY